MNPFPINKETVKEFSGQLGIDRLAYATIRQIVQMANKLEQHSGTKFIRTEMGVPGLPATPTGIEAEIEALKKGAASIYPPIEGVGASNNTRLVQNLADAILGRHSSINEHQIRFKSESNGSPD